MQQAGDYTRIVVLVLAMTVIYIAPAVSRLCDVSWFSHTTRPKLRLVDPSYTVKQRVVSFGQLFCEIRNIEVSTVLIRRL